MKKGETAMFTLPPHLAYGVEANAVVPPNSTVQFEVELLSWITVVDVCKDGGIIKKILKHGEPIGPPGDHDEVCVRYEALLADGTIMAKTREDGVEFNIEDGHFCPALTKAVKTMRRGEQVKLVVQPKYVFDEPGKEADGEHPSIPPKSVLYITAELVSFKSVVDITGDLKVKKKVLKEGDDTLTANEGATVTIRYKGMLEDGTVFESKGFDGSEPLKFLTGEEQMIDGMDRAACTMKKNEFALVTISPEYGFGSGEVKRDLAVVPPSSTILYEVEMLDFVREKAPWEMSNTERIEAATQKKEEGNHLFKIEKFQRAAAKYNKAADYVSEYGSFTDDDEKLVRSLRISCWLNGTACCLKLCDFQGAISLCSRILNTETCNVKALYRRARAYIEVSEFQLAEVDIRKTLELDPHNRDAKLLQQKLKQLRAESNKRDANLYRAMFPSVSRDDSPAPKRLKIVEDAKEG
ncbi:70 kDa peptidyl-prolyl isomerase-like isoform X2 [Andrographis paniculata]|nr:70 kDa peptidyl-prolyl isomerase-like isoform X2 [Andrographis paniculata]